MSYIGVQPTAGQYRQLDDISGSFNGATVTFTTSVGGLNVTAGSAEQLLVSLGGVIQNPGADYSVSTNSITFTTAPGSGLDFFAILMGDAVNVGTPADGSVTSVKLASDLTVDLASGTVSAPSLTFDANTGLFSPGADEVAVSVGGSEAYRVDSSGRLLINPATLIDLDSGVTTAYPKIQVAGEGANIENALTIVHADDDTAVSGRLVFARSGGTTVARTLPDDDTELGSTDYLLYDGSVWQTACRMYVTTKKPGSGDAPGRFFLQVTPDGTTTPVTRIDIDEDGDTRMSGVYAATTGSAANVFVASSGQLLRSTSSIKYKTNVETLEDQYADSILNCRPVWYQSTSEIDNPDWGWWGFIAEEVAQIDPRLVHWKTSEVVDDVEVPCDPEAEGVQYDRFVPHLVNLIKRQKEQIEALEARLSALESN